MVKKTNVDDLIVIDGTLSDMLYSKENGYGNGHFGIMLISVQKLYRGEIPEEFGHPPLCTLKCVGTYLLPLVEGNRYRVMLSLETDKKWGKQFKIVSITEPFDMQDSNNVWEYLGSELTENQFKILYDGQEKIDVLQALANSDVEELSKLKGIGPTGAKRIIRRYNDNLSKLEQIVRLKDMGFSPAVRKSLLKQYPEPMQMAAFCDELKHNFYAIMNKVKGFGWERTDKIAREQHGFTEGCKERIQAYITYFFDDIANSKGHSWVKKEELLDAIFEIAPNADPHKVGEYIKDMLDRNLLLYDRAGQRIGSQLLYDVEKATAQELVRLMKAPNWELEGLEESIKRCEKETGFEYTDQQKAVMQGISENKVTVVTGSAGCVDCDTEFFNGYKWKRIADWEPGDKVLQYNPDGTATLVTPERYIKHPSEKLNLVQTKYGIDMCVSDDHTIIYQTQKKNLAHRPFSEVAEMHANSVQGFAGKFYTSFIYDGEGLPLNDWEIKMMCAVICDGSFLTLSPNSNWCRFHIKKERKKEKLQELFAEGGVEYREHQSAAEGYTDFGFYAPIRTKIFTKEWYKASQHQLRIICDNILFWDGCEDGIRKRFSANNKENAEFVQFAFTACGYKAVLDARDRRGQIRGKYVRKSIDYGVSITKRNMVTIGGFHPNSPSKTKIVPYTPIDGMEYCFTVPSHMWVSRRNGKIVITGNCGKSSVMYPITETLKRQGKLFAIVALSGKASLNIGEATHSVLFSSTIHRLLGFTGGAEDETGDNKRASSTFFDDTTEEMQKPNYSRDPLTGKLIIDFLIVDEVSMIGGYLFRRLVEALPDHAKLVLVGDEGQLEAIGYANVLWDIKKSGVVPYYTLTKIMRQAARSGILSDSLRIYRKEQFIPADLLEPVVHGELNDFKIVPQDTSEEIAAAALEEYRDFIKKGVSPKDIMVITQKRARGVLASAPLNVKLQAIANPFSDERRMSWTYHDSGEEYKIEYRVGDQVMMMQNDYHVMVAEPTRYDDNEVAVFNGNVGTIVDIYVEAPGSKKKSTSYERLIIQFPQGKVVFFKSMLDKLQLGYAATCHKLQGVGVPYVIGVVDPSAYTLLTNEALYTEITRAKKYCTLIGSPRTIRMAVKKSSVKAKQTWLAELLQEEYDAAEQSPLLAAENSDIPF